ncbi:MAG: hypothetical protein H6715_03350 [Myxococcales bacterium]|nr:hypothetical protein [Myxococcales bacterium]MCB9708883.1 hypothetical protein [Myxococcales bacterium]
MNNVASTLDYDIHIAADDPMFRGHFEGNPILPGIFQLHNLVLHRARAAWPSLERVTRISRLKFLEPIRPDEHLTIHLIREEQRVRFAIYRATRLCSSGCLWFE